MKNRFSFLLSALGALTLVPAASEAQNKDAVVLQTFHVAGNCGMCKKTIEKAAGISGVKKASWHTGKKQLTVKYDTTQVKSTEILKKIAEAGYDNEKFTAPDAAYSGLHGCCKYEREPEPGAVKLE